MLNSYNQYKPEKMVRSLHLVNYLLDKGQRLHRVRLDKYDAEGKRLIFFFFETPELQSTIDEYIKIYQALEDREGIDKFRQEKNPY